METWKPKTKTVFDVFCYEARFFFAEKRPFSLLQHLARRFKRLFCEFQHHQIKAIKVRCVLLQTSKTQKKLFWCFFSAQYDFCALQLPFLMLQHLVHPIGRLSCDFDCLWCDTRKIWFVLVRTWKPQEPLFCVTCPRRIFLSTKLLFLVFGIPYALEWTAILLLWAYLQRYLKIAKRFLGVFRKTLKNPFIRHFFWSRGYFFAVIFAIFTVCIHSAIKSAVKLYVWAQSKLESENMRVKK